jgi:hypothetical protein
MRQEPGREAGLLHFATAMSARFLLQSRSDFQLIGE